MRIKYMWRRPQDNRTYLGSERDGLPLVGATEKGPPLFRRFELGDLNRIRLQRGNIVL
jgi:hypothetical protein